MHEGIFFSCVHSTLGGELSREEFHLVGLFADVLNKNYLLAACNLLGAIPGDDWADFFRSIVFLAPLVDSVATRDYDEKHTIYMVLLYIPSLVPYTRSLRRECLLCLE